MILRDILKVLDSPRHGGRNLTVDEAAGAFLSILSGEESEIRVAGFLMAMRWKGVTTEELVGFTRAARMRAKLPCAGIEHLVAVTAPLEGYEGTPPLEVASGMIAAAAGARVLIVTERCLPPRRGLTAASVLQQLGCGLTWDPSEVEDWVVKARFGAICAVGMLPALLSLRDVRRDLELRTPLATVEKLLVPPAAVLVVGAQRGPVLGTAVEVMQRLGHPRGIVIQGPEGGVVPTVAKRTRGIQLDGLHQVPMTLEPDDFGLSGRDAELPMFGPPDAGRGAGDNPQLVGAATALVEGVLAGEMGPARNQSLLGAAIMLRAAAIVPTFADGVSLATEALDSGEASAILERLRSLV